MQNFSAKAFLIMILCIFLNLNINAQTKKNILIIENSDYKFKITLPSGWTNSKIEETSKKDAISYSFDSKDGKMAILLIGFKVKEVKNLDDFIYTLEKDATLDIPMRTGQYKDFDQGTYDGKSAIYKDTEFTESIHFYRTKLSDVPENYTYMLRFIVPTTYYNSTMEYDIKKIVDSFSIVTSQ